MVQPQESPQIIKARYKKANSEYKKVILKKYGISNINRIDSVLSNKMDTIKLNKTELASLLLRIPDVTITVSFQKQAKLENTVERLMRVYENTAPVGIKNALKKVLEIDILLGETRIVKGFHRGKLDKFGRLYMTETTVPLDKTANSDNRMVLVTLNHLNWVEVNNCRYTLK